MIKKVHGMQKVVLILFVPWIVVYALYIFPLISPGFGGARPITARLIGDTQRIQRINTVIAAAGSSPAYLFLFAQAMQDEAMAMGMEKDDARLLVQQALLGSAEMICHNPDLELSELRAQVTSKGGTTAQAVNTFIDEGLKEIVSKSMRAAVARAEEMAKQL